MFSSAEIYPTEYARVILAPSYYQLEASDFEMSLLEVLYPDKFYRLSHSQVFGFASPSIRHRKKVFW